MREKILCRRGHDVGQLRDGVLSFARPRAGAEQALVAFWSTSEEYYEAARQMNVTYEDEAHASHRRLLDAVAETRPRRVLDVGCGTGEISVALRERIGGVEYVGIDVSTLAPGMAHALGRPGIFVAADAERLPFADLSFDAVVSLYALEHFTQPQQAIAEMVRVLRHGGVLALLSLSLDRPWGTMPSIRLGLVWRGRKLPRWHPANVAVYAFNRVRFAARQAAKQVRYAVDPGYVSFEVIDRPLVLDEPYQSDLDAVHVVSGRTIVRVLAAAGVEIVDTSHVPGPLGAFRIPREFRVIGRKV